MKIFLLGLPGSGKTTLGKELAGLLGLRFVDLDLEIERGAAKKITEIFGENGEDYFRELESLELRKWCTSPERFVMATGGGAPCFMDNMETINQSGKSIFLDVPAGVLAARIQLDGLAERPLLASLQSDELMGKIQLLRSNRIVFYERAHFILSGEAITSAEMVEKLVIGKQ